MNTIAFGILTNLVVLLLAILWVFAFVGIYYFCRDKKEGREPFMSYRKLSINCGVTIVYTFLFYISTKFF